MHSPNTHLPRAGRHLPITTYRLQLGASFTFDDARAQLPYLRELGVTDLYLSPVLEASPGSTHGYDVVDHTRISSVMGGRDGLESLARDAHAAGMGIVLDIVPNHMSVPTPLWHNPPLWSVLRNGTDSPYANWFDAPRGERLLMPVLGKRIGQALTDGEFTVERMLVPTESERGEQWVLRYYDHVFPLAAGTQSLTLPELLQRQHYRLAYWRVGDEELNYRRFFDIATLAAVRVEDPEVFAGSHALILELLESGTIDALRVDHPDGLADPEGYFARLSHATGGAWIAAEKILAPDELLPTSWHAAGTTGYDASWRIDQLQVDPAGARTLGSLMRELTGNVPIDYDRVCGDAKREIIAGSLAAEVNRLVELLHAITSRDLYLSDHTFRDLRACVVELLVAADRYRAYMLPGQKAEAEQAAVLRATAQQARERLTADQYPTLDLVVAILLGEQVGAGEPSDSPERAEIITRFQQVCGAVTAKGVEDTTFYRWTHLTSLTEVGGDPGGFALPADEAHAWAQRVQHSWPATMVTSTTHDTKRSEDVRARIDVLASYSAEWVELVHRLRDLTADVRPADLDGVTENLLWQTLWGAWAPASGDPLDSARLAAYLIKASREQKSWTTWTDPDTERESQLADYASSLLARADVAEELNEFAALTSRAVTDTILAKKAMTLTWLGVADVYQGSEVTRTSLVDPDNRRPVAYTGVSGLRAALGRVSQMPSDTKMTLDEAKLALTSRLCRLRAERPDTFVGDRSGYQPLPTTTACAFAYARLCDGEPDVAVVVRRLGRRLERLGGWAGHTIVLPQGTWTNVLTGAGIDGGTRLLAEVVGDESVAVLARPRDLSL
ncbi:malto-oligosyltrehalose synthase [Actinomyces sp.]|uniref:malto-oligosyltrehalose synthase n=1 Tax=Actinomyces sp. TaxID=29317 RepID=UPI0026DD16CA|nr:malto-oligosyltrehalose synthase [Actinomyces sp.]MDO4900441.1 malto-oligosyltrehalose synthase [Actinomyces sp.]